MNFICGDALTELKKMKDETIDCVMTSPPYWALRDYGIKGQLGLESTFQEYITKLCEIFDEVKRALKKSGTCWVNLGDSYSNSGKGGDSNRLYAQRHTQFGKICDIRRHGKPTRVKNLPPKSLCNIPARFSIEMQNRGWILRNIIIWHKPNCMPSSVKDKFTVDFEYLFFFVKNKKYWFEMQYEKSLTYENRPHGIVRDREWDYNSKRKKIRISLGQKSFSKRQAKGKRVKPSGNAKKDFYEVPFNRNKRCVWAITTKPFKEAHFAVFPEKLVETPIKAGCPKGGVVLDPFCGSGTTGVVAKKLERNFIGIDINPEYIKMAEKRTEKEKSLWNIEIK